jgi:hypothetical protein
MLHANRELGHRPVNALWCSMSLEPYCSICSICGPNYDGRMRCVVRCIGWSVMPIIYLCERKNWIPSFHTACMYFSWSVESGNWEGIKMSWYDRVLCWYTIMLRIFMTLWKIVQRHTYDLLSHKYSVLIIVISFSAILVSVIQFGEVSFS